MEKKIETVLMTAELAKLWMDHELSKTRKFRTRRINRYKKAMIEGRWRGLNGVTIKVKEDGSLGDGWHRLLSIIEADKVVPGISIPMYVLWGATEEDILTVDTGGNRTIQDILTMNGEKWPTTLGPALTCLYTYAHDSWLDPDNRPDNDQLDALLDANEEITDFLTVGDGVWRNTKLNRTASIVSAYVIDRAHEDEDRVKSFYDGLIEGIGLEERSPILALRNYGISGAWRTRDSRGTQQRVMVATLKAFNYWVTGRGIKQMKVYYKEEIPPVIR